MVGVIGNSSRERDRELLIPVADSIDHHHHHVDDSSKPLSSASASHHNSGREVWFYGIIISGLQEKEADFTFACWLHYNLDFDLEFFISLSLQNYAAAEELCCVYVPTNHLYIGDIFLVNANDVIRPNLSVREGIEIVVSGGMSMPQILSTLDPRTIQVDRNRSNRS
ncbi:uncharacterized protein LOC111365554 [Olea europaea var. sylvestris]|uniref:uncharacterized protein LOC111365554 n=1 Tax=Olea europaea var. sylvestris TaxID=158386 RepID=UPI000C1CF8C2|nr:uncharacterized protein LOC111365554 [Olea europaea var. sylvestris]